MQDDEPFAGLFTQGMVVHETYRDADGCMDAAGRGPDRADGGARRAVHGTTGEPVEIGPIEKMSKSRKNTVDPDDIIASYGADTARWFMLSDSPPERDVIWTEEGVAGRGRFVQRVWRLVGEIADAVGNGDARRTAAPARTRRKRSPFARPRTARSPRSSEDIEGLRFNVAVAKIYELANALQALLADTRGRSPTGSARRSARRSRSSCGCSPR